MCLLSIIFAVLAGGQREHVFTLKERRRTSANAFPRRFWAGTFLVACAVVRVRTQRAPADAQIGHACFGSKICYWGADTKHSANRTCTPHLRTLTFNHRAARRNLLTLQAWVPGGTPRDRVLLSDLPIRALRLMICAQSKGAQETNYRSHTARAAHTTSP